MKGRGEKHQCVSEMLTGCLLHTPNQGPGPQSRHDCLDWESNQRSFPRQAGAQPTEPHQPGHLIFLLQVPRATRSHSLSSTSRVEELLSDKTKSLM